MTNPLELLWWALAGHWWLAAILAIGLGILLAIAVFTGGW